MRPDRPSIASVSPKFAIGAGDAGGGVRTGAEVAVATPVVPRIGVDEGVSVAAIAKPGVGLGLAVGAAPPPQARARTAVRASRTAVTDNLTVLKLPDTATLPFRLFTKAVPIVSEDHREAHVTNYKNSCQV